MQSIMNAKYMMCIPPISVLIVLLTDLIKKLKVASYNRVTQTILMRIDPQNINISYY
jgi:hypothetical protein